MTDSEASSPGLEALPLTPPLNFPEGQSESTIKDLFDSLEVDGAPKHEFENYWRLDWKRFVYTCDLVSKLPGSCLELGANPYFTTMLMRYFTELDLTLGNYFGSHFAAASNQSIAVKNPLTGEAEQFSLEFKHFNIEDASFPFPAACFDVVLFCEVIEHLQADPVKVLREIRRVLRPGGHLVLTTPNVSRLENVARMLAGTNIYDPYSGYGPYGRHNREYNKHELALLLNYCGFEVETLFSADVNENISANLYPLKTLIPLVKFRQHDLGQYLFLRAKNVNAGRDKRPAWLYRSYPPGELES